MNRNWKAAGAVLALGVLLVGGGCVSESKKAAGEAVPPPQPAKPVVVNAANGPLDVSTKIPNPNEVRGKEAVIKRLQKLFAETNPGISLMSSNYHIEAPNCRIVKSANGRATMFYRFRYVMANTLTDAVESLISDQGVVEPIEKLGEKYPYQNAMMVHDTVEKIGEIKDFLLAVDVPQPQIMVEAQIIEVYIEEGAQRDVKMSYTHYDARTDTTNSMVFNNQSPSQTRLADQGANFDFFPVSSTSSDGSKDTLNTAVRLLNTSNDARILSAPNIVADQGITATISTGEELPIPSSQTTTSSTNLSFEYKRIGVSLKITPILVNKNTVQLEVSPEVTTAIRYQSFNVSGTASVIPVVSVRNISTRLTVADGDVVSLGGLYSTELNENLRKVPYISDIPVFGDLFTGRDTKNYDKQLLFFMKVHIMPQPGAAMFNPDTTARQAQEISRILGDSDQIFINKPAVPRYDLETKLEEYEKLNIDELELKREERRLKLLKQLEALRKQSEQPTAE